MIKRLMPAYVLSLCSLLGSTSAFADADGKRRDGPYPLIGSYKALDGSTITVAPTHRLRSTSPSKGAMEVDLVRWMPRVRGPGATYHVEGRARGKRVRFSMDMRNTDGVGSPQVMKLRVKGLFSSAARAMRRQLGLNGWSFLGKKRYVRTATPGR